MKTVAHSLNTLREFNANFWRKSVVNSFRPKIRINLNAKNYIIKTAATPLELEKALLLRHEVFYRELLQHHRPLGLDIDHFDLQCDHLIILDKRDLTCIGTYRLNPSYLNHHYYSAKEFFIENILRLPGNKLELGRSCIHSDYRNGLGIALLWRGLSAYIRESGASYVFGCSSIVKKDDLEIAALYKLLAKDYYSSDDQRVYPRRQFRIKNFDICTHELAVSPVDLVEGLSFRALPPLLRTYLNAGAKICGKPAYDRHFRCFDFFTLLDIKHLNKAFEEKYDLA